MLHSLQALITPALAARLTLLFNHVLASEPVATQRLRPHAGRQVRLVLDNWPTLLPAAPELAWRVTPAGLLDWLGEPQAGAGAGLPAASTDFDLTVRLDARNPALLMFRTAAGEPPLVQVEGDAALAGDINWLVQNLRWDVAADLERLFGPAVAQQLQQWGRGLASAMRAAQAQASSLAERLRSRRT